ncbi:MAG: potassium transporter [Gammaproteobacteria bacterium]|nr:potassium transporter [Gammaproteobacteria bacterium]
MQTSVIFRILGLLLMMFSFSMLPPIAINWYYHDGASYPFLLAFALTFITGLICWFPLRHKHAELKIRDGFLVVVLFWLVLSFFGALPFLFDHLHGITFTNAIFESISGLTTTGANVFHNLAAMPHDILFYRQQLHLLGGMGIIVLAVAILPMLGVGGMQLYRAETPGPIKDAKLTPRITETAKTLWYIYLTLIAICGLSYWLAGMSPFDAVCESFSTISTGGFSPHDASLAYYHSNTIDLICSLFMLLSAVNFGLHFAALQSRSVKTYWKNSEFRVYILVWLIAVIAVVTTLICHHTYQHISDDIVKGITNTTSLSATAGYSDGNFGAWPTFVPFLIMFMALVGGCAGSTAGGLKIIRLAIMSKQAKRELMRLLHPKAIFSIKLGGRTLPEQIVQAVLGFVAIYILIYVVLLMLTLATGTDITTAYGALSACITNAGAGIGKVSENFDTLNIASKWLMIVAMFVGRLEFLTVLVLFTPAFWRK